MQIHYIQTSLNKRVVLAWCPGHTGIAGNERADIAAKSAMRSSYKQTYKDLAYQDFANAAQHAITISFRDWWQNMDPTTNKLRLVKTSPTSWNTSTQDRPYPTHSWSSDGGGPSPSMLGSSSLCAPLPHSLQASTNNHLTTLPPSKHPIYLLFVHLKRGIQPLDHSAP
jgi:hypothetical protein